MSYTLAVAVTDKALAPVQKMMSQQATIYLGQHQSLIPLLDRYGYYVPADLRALTLAGTR